jgi:hypothetical protein
MSTLPAADAHAGDYLEDHAHNVRSVNSGGRVSSTAAGHGDRNPPPKREHSHPSLPPSRSWGFISGVLVGVFVCVGIAAIALLQEDTAAEAALGSIRGTPTPSTDKNIISKNIQVKTVSQPAQFVRPTPPMQPTPVTQPFHPTQTLNNPHTNQAVANEPADWQLFLEHAPQMLLTGHQGQLDYLSFHRENNSLISMMNESTGPKALSRVDGFVDGENVDVLEHFFWCGVGGIAMELGKAAAAATIL